MRYALLIYANTDNPPPLDEVEHAQWMQLTEEMNAAGVNTGGAALHPPDMTTAVTARDGELVNTDGPFAETKEILGGLYILDVADLDAAIAWAQKVPRLDHYAVELRPCVEFA